MIDFTIETRGGFSVLVYADKSCRLAHDTEIVLFTEISRLTEEVDKERRDRCDTCGAKVSSYPNGCPTCGAPQCCQWCCKRDALQKELDEALGKVKGMSDEVKMSVEPRGMTPEECILLIQDALKIKDATISRLTEEVDKAWETASIANIDILQLKADLAAARKVIEGVRECFIWMDGEPFYRTENSVPQHIPSKTKKAIKGFLK